MSTTPNSPKAPTVGLRERHVQTLPKDPSTTTKAEQFPSYVDEDDEKEQKTFGRTPDGTSASPVPPPPQEQ